MKSPNMCAKSMSGAVPTGQVKIAVDIGVCVVCVCVVCVSVSKMPRAGGGGRAIDDVRKRCPSRVIMTLSLCRSPMPSTYDATE
jgi:hypothetical protein